MDCSLHAFLTYPCCRERSLCPAATSSSCPAATSRSTSSSFFPAAASSSCSVSRRRAHQPPSSWQLRRPHAPAAGRRRASQPRRPRAQFNERRAESTRMRVNQAEAAEELEPRMRRAMLGSHVDSSRSLHPWIFPCCPRVGYQGRCCLDLCIAR